jgi:hypothetical protein
MRILEQCSSTWPLPEIQAQIDSLRLAFSADINRPFELRSSFPYGSPSEQYHPSPPPLDAQYNSQFSQPPASSPSRLGYSAHPITPPISARAEDSKPDSPQLQTLGAMHHNPPSSHPLGVPLVDENSWDPTRIIKYESFLRKIVNGVADVYHSQWDMAFSVTPSNTSTNSPPIAFNNAAQGIVDTMSNQYPIQYAAAEKMLSMGPAQSAPQPFSAQPIIMTARDWQQSVASVYDPQGLKRKWNYSIDMSSQNTSKRT